MRETDEKYNVFESKIPLVEKSNKWILSEIKVNGFSVINKKEIMDLQDEPFFQGQLLFPPQGVLGQLKVSHTCLSHVFFDFSEVKSAVIESSFFQTLVRHSCFFLSNVSRM